ncbi:MAG: DUF2938 family protein [Bacteroidetes bacterium]|nr:DUF2938 family protein [Bacteroidota bacterium]
MKTNINKILIGGLIATAAMTTLMIMAPMMGMPEMPIGNMMAGFIGVPVVAGWMMHVMIGLMLAAGYVLVFRKIIPRSDALSGMIYSILPFLMAQLVVMPMMGAGLFSTNTPAPMLMVAGSLMGHLVYGVVLGAITKKIEASEPELKAV